jgi:hypothetical protein
MCKFARYVLKHNLAAAYFGDVEPVTRGIRWTVPDASLWELTTPSRKTAPQPLYKYPTYCNTSNHATAQRIRLLYLAAVLTHAHTE